MITETTNENEYYEFRKAIETPPCGKKCPLYDWWVEEEEGVIDEKT